MLLAALTSQLVPTHLAQTVDAVAAQMLCAKVLAYKFALLLVEKEGRREPSDSVLAEGSRCRLGDNLREVPPRGGAVDDCARDIATA